MVANRRVGWAAFGVLVMVFLLITTYSMANTSVLVDLIRTDQKAGQQRAKDTNENTERIRALAAQIESCTTPDGECYKQSTARTGSAIAMINQITILAAACAKRPENVTAGQIRACVEALLPASPSTE